MNGRKAEGNLSDGELLLAHYKVALHGAFYDHDMQLEQQLVLKGGGGGGGGGRIRGIKNVNLAQRFLRILLRFLQRASTGMVDNCNLKIVSTLLPLP